MLMLGMKRILNFMPQTQSHASLGKAAVYLKRIINTNHQLVEPLPTGQTAICGYSLVLFHEMMVEHLHYFNRIEHQNEQLC